LNTTITPTTTKNLMACTAMNISRKDNCFDTRAACFLRIGKTKIPFFIKSHEKEDVKLIFSISGCFWFSDLIVTYGLSALKEFSEKWDKRYPHVSASWKKNWGEISIFFKYPPEIRTLIYTTNPIESLHRQIKKVAKNKSSSPGRTRTGGVPDLLIV